MGGVDVATLGIRIDGTESIVSVEKLGQVADKVSKQTDALEASAKRAGAGLSTFAKQVARDAREVQQALRDQFQIGSFSSSGLSVPNGLAGQPKVLKDIADSGAQAATGLARFRGVMTSVATTALHASPEVGKFASTIGMLALGSATTVGVLAGLAAIGFAYRALTADARRAKEEAAAAHDRLRQLRQERLIESTPGGQPALDKPTLQKDLERAQAMRAGLLAARNAKPARGSDPVDVAAMNAILDTQIRRVNSKIDEFEKDLKEANMRVSEWGIDHTARINQVVTDTKSAWARDMANLIAHNRATKEQRAYALSELRLWEAEFKKLSVSDVAGRARMSSDIQALRDALFPKDTAGIKAANQLKNAVESLERVQDEINRTRETAALMGQEKSIENWLLSTIDTLQRTEAEFPKLGGKIQLLINQARAAAQLQRDAEAKRDFDDVESRARELAREADERNRVLRAQIEGKLATDALTIALAGENAVRALGDKATAQQIANARARAEEQQRENNLLKERLELSQMVIGSIDIPQFVKDANDPEGARQRKQDADRLADLKRQEMLLENLLRSMQDRFSQFFADVFTKGISSFRDLFGGIKDLFLKMVADMIAASMMKKVTATIAGMLGGLLSPTVAQAQGQNALPGSVNNLSLAGSGLAGFGIGYGIGNMTTNRGLGALGGMAGGAAMGFAIAGPVGAAVGGLAGFVGGLFGVGSAAKRAREEAKMLEAAKKDLAATMEILRVKSQGGNTALLEAIESNRKYFEQLKLQIDAALPGKKNEAERNRQREEADRMRAIEDQRIREDHARREREMREDLEVRKLRAQGREEQAEAVRFALDQERELAEARRNGADAATLATLAEIQRMEAAKKAAEEAKRYAEQQRQFGEDLAGRFASATGRTREAEDIALASRHRRELREAEELVRTGGLNADFLQMLRLIQELERNQVARDRQFADLSKAVEEAARAEIAAIDKQIAALTSADREFSEGKDREIAAARDADKELQRVLGAQLDAVRAQATETARAFDRQIDQAREAAREEQRVLDAQIDVLRDAAREQQRALDAQMDAIRSAAREETRALDLQIDAIRDAARQEQERFDAEIQLQRDALAVANEQLRAQEQAVQATQRVVESLRSFSSGLSLNPGLTVLGPIEQLDEARRQYEALLAQANAGDRDAAGGLPSAAQALLNASRGVNASGPGYLADFTRVQESIAGIGSRFGAQLTTEQLILQQLKDQSATLERQIAELQAAKDAAGRSAESQLQALQKAKDDASRAAELQLNALQVAKDQAAQNAERQITELQKAKDLAATNAERHINELQKAKDAAAQNAERQIAELQKAKDAANEAAQRQIEALQLAKDQANARAQEQLAALQKAKDEAQANADRQLEELIRARDEAAARGLATIDQLINQRDALDAYRAESDAWFREQMEKLIEIALNTRRTADGIGRLQPPDKPRIDPVLPIPMPVPTPVDPAIVQSLETTNTELRALVNVQVDANKQLLEELALLRGEMERNTSTTRQGMENLS